jgi:hypothetical protein
MFTPKSLAADRGSRQTAAYIQICLKRATLRRRRVIYLYIFILHMKTATQ